MRSRGIGLNSRWLSLLALRKWVEQAGNIPKLAKPFTEDELAAQIESLWLKKLDKGGSSSQFPRGWRETVSRARPPARASFVGAGLPRGKAGTTVR